MKPTTALHPFLLASSALLCISSAQVGVLPAADFDTMHEGDSIKGIADMPASGTRFFGRFQATQ